MLGLVFLPILSYLHTAIRKMEAEVVAMCLRMYVFGLFLPLRRK